jgi:D-arabinose 1-dehydrogenase-like Zn-dependent alcohol dehydrogenase
MRAVQVSRYGEPAVVASVPEPRVSDPFDVLVRVAGAGVCRTDVHILSGSLQDAFRPALPFTLGHENAGWVEAVGSGVSHVATGDAVIVHPASTCGFCSGCRAGNDMHCASWAFPGVDGRDGGYAELLLTRARSVVRLAPGVDPARVAPHADAGLTAIHAVKRLAPFVDARSTVLVTGAGGGLGHLALQLLRLYTPARVIGLEASEERAEFARGFGPDEVYVRAVGESCDAVLDLVGEGPVPAAAVATLRKGGVYSIVGYGGDVRLEHLDVINRELTVLGNQIGSHADRPHGARRPRPPPARVTPLPLGRRARRAGRARARPHHRPSSVDSLKASYASRSTGSSTGAFVWAERSSAAASSSGTLADAPSATSGSPRSIAAARLR